MGKLPTVAPELKDLPHVPVDCLEPFQGDLKTLSTREYNKLKKSILEKGLFVPFFVWKEENRLLDGHQRERVFLKEGWLMPVPVIYISAENEQDAKERLLLISSQYGKVTQDGWDEFTFDLNDTWIKETLNFDALPFVFGDMADDEGGESKDAEPQINRADELQKIWGVELGQMWRLPSRTAGQEHRLICGDCTDSAVVERVMGGEKADMVWTDPPYGMGLDTDYSKIKGTDKSPNALGYTYEAVVGDDKPFDFSPFRDFNCKEQFWWGGDYYAQQLPMGGSWDIWIKRNEADAEMIGNDFEMCWSKQRHKRHAVRIRWVGWDATEQNETRAHPTQKPVSLASWHISKYSKEGDVIVDFFSGSAPAIIAAENLSRQCRAVEISPAYCAVSLQRYQDAFGITPELITDEVTAVPAPAGAYNDDPHD